MSPVDRLRRFWRWLVGSAGTTPSAAPAPVGTALLPQRANRVEIATLVVSLLSFLTVGLTQCQLNKVQSRVTAAEAESTVQYSYWTITIFDFCSPEGGQVSEDLTGNTAEYKQNQAWSLANGYVHNEVWDAFQDYLKKTCPMLDATVETRTPHTLAFIQVQNKNAAFSPRIDVTATIVPKRGAAGIWDYPKLDGTEHRFELGLLDSTDIIRLPVAFLDPRGVPEGKVLVPRKLSWTSRLDGSPMEIELDFIKDRKSWRGFSPRMGVVGN
jgi:hypothetical protein